LIGRPLLRSIEPQRIALFVRLHRAGPPRREVRPERHSPPRARPVGRPQSAQITHCPAMAMLGPFPPHHVKAGVELSAPPPRLARNGASSRPRSLSSNRGDELPQRLPARHVPGYAEEVAPTPRGRLFFRLQVQQDPSGRAVMFCAARFQGAPHRPRAQRPPRSLNPAVVSAGNLAGNRKVPVRPLAMVGLPLPLCRAVALDSGANGRNSPWWARENARPAVEQRSDPPHRAHRASAPWRTGRWASAPLSPSSPRRRFSLSSVDVKDGGAWDRPPHVATNQPGGPLHLPRGSAWRESQSAAWPWPIFAWWLER